MDAETGTRVSILRSEQAGSRATLDREERVVKDGILRMGSLVESQIRDAVRAFAERDLQTAEAVVAADDRINEAQHEIGSGSAITPHRSPSRPAAWRKSSRCGRRRRSP